MAVDFVTLIPLLLVSIFFLILSLITEHPIIQGTFFLIMLIFMLLAFNTGSLISQANSLTNMQTMFKAFYFIGLIIFITSFIYYVIFWVSSAKVYKKEIRELQEMGEWEE